MELQAELVHAEPGRRVVRVSARQGTQLLGSSLGEAEDAETAEDRAISRLRARLAAPGASPAAARAAVPPPIPAPRAAPPAPASSGDAPVAPDLFSAAAAAPSTATPAPA